MTEPSAEDPYYRAIEEEFVRRRGSLLLLSPRDWGLIGSWKDAGIPLPVVLRAIHNVFDAFERRAASGASGRRINSLGYCRQEVLALHDLYRSLHAVEAGRPDAVAAGPPEAMVRHLGRLHRSTRAAMAAASAGGHDALVGALAAAGAELKRLRRDARSGAVSVTDVENELSRLDAALLETARAVMLPDALAELKREAEAGLQERRARMTAEAFDATVRAHLARALRRRLAFPRLSLFDPAP